VYSCVTLNAKMSSFGTDTFATLFKFMTSMYWSSVWWRLRTKCHRWCNVWVAQTSLDVYSCQRSIL